MVLPIFCECVMKVLNINKCFLELEEKFNKNGKELSKHDFYTMVAKLLDVSFLNAKMVTLINNNVYKKLKKYAKKLMTGMPIQYVVNSTNFCGYEIYVDENVLIPRFDTEALIPIVAKGILDNDSILDMCTGSGAMGLAIVKRAEDLGKNVKLTISDISEKALAIAKQNCYKNYVDAVAVKSDLFENITEKFDVIVCNPPYITDADYENLEPMVKDFEPKLALVSGESGYEYYERIIPMLKDHLTYRGKVYFEYGINQEEYIKKLLVKDFRCIKIIKDNSGINRFISATKRD